MYYYMNPRRKIMVLQFIILIGLIIIGYGIYRVSDQSTDLTTELSALDMSCPKCPDLTNPIKKSDLTITQACPECPKCPSVPDIVSGIFPGRNTGITRSGRHFDVKSEGSYDALPDYSFYKAEDAFPDDSILDPPLRWQNFDAPLNDINNSIDNYYADTNSSADLRRHKMGMDRDKKPDLSRMNMSMAGKSTKPKSSSKTTKPGAFASTIPSSDVPAIS
jgi:hypothetical protein